MLPSWPSRQTYAMLCVIFREAENRECKKKDIPMSQTCIPNCSGNARIGQATLCGNRLCGIRIGQVFVLPRSFIFFLVLQVPPLLFR